MRTSSLPEHQLPALLVPTGMVRLGAMEWLVMAGFFEVGVCQNLVPLVNIKIAGKWMFIPLKMVLIGIDPYPYMIIDMR
jgi:hypothetical protein